MTSLRALWNRHRASPFPADLRGSELGGEDLVLLDANIAGCVQSFLATGGRLDDARLAILQGCYRTLCRIEPSLAGEQRAYFGRLREMAQEALRCLEGGLADA